jgi:hypothetical protein
MDLYDIDTHVAARAAVRITFGPAKGMTGILLGYNQQYDTVRVGFLDENGAYSGEKTTQARTSVELIDDTPVPAPCQSPTSISGTPASAAFTDARTIVTATGETFATERKAYWSYNGEYYQVSRRTLKNGDLRIRIVAGKHHIPGAQLGSRAEEYRDLPAAEAETLWVHVLKAYDNQYRHVLGLPLHV